MLRTKSIFAAAAAMFAMIFIGCSDTGKGSDEINIREPKANSVGKTEDGHDVLVFQEGEIDKALFKIDTTTVSDTGFTGTLLFRDLDENKIPQAGDIMASGQTTVAEYGFLYKVIGVSTVNGVTTVEVRSASLEEAIENVDFKSETELQFDEEGNVVDVVQKSSTFGKLQLKTPYIPIKVGGMQVAKIKAQVAYSMSFNFDISIKDWKLQSTKMTLVNNGDITINAVLGDFKEELKPRPQLAEPIFLPSITFWIGPVPVVITNEIVLELKLKSEIQAGIEAIYTLNGRGEYGFEWRNGGFNRIIDNNFSHSFNLEHQLSGSARCGIILGLRSSLYGTVGFIIGAGPVLDLYVGGNPIGTHVFENGFRSDYFEYRSIWAGSGIVGDLESGSADINLAINNSGSTANSNFSRTIANEARADLGVNFEASINLKVLKHELLRFTFAEAYLKYRTLYRTSFLPLFADPEITSIGTNVEVNSQIERDLLNYPVKSYGICVEKPYSNECRNGQGMRVVKDESVKAGTRHNFTAEFNSLAPGQSYAIRPYFSTGLGTYYDKATPYTHDVEYELTVNRNPAVGGTILVNGNVPTGPTIRKHGTHIIVTAIENQGYEFTGWSGASTSKDAEVVVTMNNNQALTANFQARIYTLTTLESPAIGGSITRIPNALNYSAGTSVTVTATEQPGYKFIGWAGASTSENSTTSVIMDDDKTLIAMFSSLSATTTYPLTTNSIPTVGGTVVRDLEWETYNHGMQVTVTANPASTYKFTSWSGTTTSTANPVTVTMDGYKTLVANFEHIKYTLKANANATTGGTVTRNLTNSPSCLPSSCPSDTYIVGTQVTVTATPQLGYKFTGWSGATTGTTNPVTITMDGNKTLTANFTRITYTLTLNRNSTSMGTVSGAGTLDSGTIATITATPASGYMFTSWTPADGIADPNSNSTTVLMVQNKTITANFVRLTTFDTTFNSSISNYTFNKGFPAIVEVYAVGSGGGGQGGNQHQFSKSDGTGGAGGGGAAVYAKFKENEQIIFNNITIGSGGGGGDDNYVFAGDWQSGDGGKSGNPTTVTWNTTNSFTVEGGKGAPRASRTDQSGGTGGRGNESIRPSVVPDNAEHWRIFDGENGGGGDRTNCVASTGGKAGAIPANTGSLTSSFGGGSGGYITSCKSNFWTLNESYYNPGRGGGGNGGWQAFAGNTGGSGQVRIRVTYPMP